MREIGSIIEFENGKYELLEDNIIPEKKKKNFILTLNLYTLLLIVPIIIVTTLLIPGGFNIALGDVSDLLVLFISIFGMLFAFLVYVIVHEWLHGIAFRIFNKNTKSQIKFGLVLKSGMAYCISTIPVTVKASRLSLMMPVYVVCIPLYLIGIFTQNVFIAILAGLFFTGSTGDIYYMWKLRKSKNDLYMYESMPTSTGYEVGYLLYKKIDE